LSGSVGPEQIFEIENSIVDVNSNVKNLSVVKIVNKHFNVTISTEIKRMDGDQGPENEEGEEQEGEEQDKEVTDRVSNNMSELTQQDPDAASIIPNFRVEEETGEHVVD
jgi:hypothetical protein